MKNKEKQKTDKKILEIFKNCYVKLTLSVTQSEIFDKTGKYVFTGKPVKVAILHCAQANNLKTLAIIKETMWTELCQEKNWDAKSFDCNKMCSFFLMEIPKKSEPITYRI